MERADDPTGPPGEDPIGRLLRSAAKEVGQAFDAALAEEGGGHSVWMVLLSLKAQPNANQREVAEMVGIQGATLTHHLNAMEAAGLVTRRRDPANRRVHVLELTDEGDATFMRLAKAASAFDRRLRAGISDREITATRKVLAKMCANVRD